MPESIKWKTRCEHIVVLAFRHACIKGFPVCILKGWNKSYPGIKSYDIKYSSGHYTYDDADDIPHSVWQNNPRQPLQTARAP